MNDRQKTIGRRDFLVGSAQTGGLLLTLMSLPRPLTLQAAEASSEPEVLAREEWQTVEAITGRIIPTDHEPGAIEANCVNFIDKSLAREDAELLKTYRDGLPALARICTHRFKKPFHALSQAEQDGVLLELEDGIAKDWDAESTSSQDFFETLRSHTIIAFLSDPKYGGNHDYIGWKVMGYPGPRHMEGGYSKEQLLGTAPIRAIWGDDV